MKRYLNKLFGLILCVCCCFALPSHSVEKITAAYEYQIKAALLYNFAHYTTWPAHTFRGTQQPFVICLFGTDPFQGALHSAVENERIEQRQVEILRIQEFADISTCHLLFTPKSEQGHQARVLEYAKRYPVLSVGETDNFIETGGIVKFIMQGNKIRFAISRRNATQSGLKISADLLYIAKTVD